MRKIYPDPTESSLQSHILFLKWIFKKYVKV